MNDSNSEMDAFEQQLRRLQPARPSDALMARLENPQGLRQARTGMNRSALIRFLVPGLGGAIALLVILAGWFVMHHELFHVSRTAKFLPAPASQAPLVCTSMTDAVVAAHDDGIYAGVDGRVVQVIHLLDINKSVWKEPRSGNRMEIVVPRQQILVNNINTY